MSVGGRGRTATVVGGRSDFDVDDGGGGKSWAMEGWRMSNFRATHMQPSYFRDNLISLMVQCGIGHKPYGGVRHAPSSTTPDILPLRRPCCTYWTLQELPGPSWPSLVLSSYQDIKGTATPKRSISKKAPFCKNTIPFLLRILR